MFKRTRGDNVIAFGLIVAALGGYYIGRSKWEFEFHVGRKDGK